MIVRAVTQILEHVLALGERSFADPVGTLATHLRIAEGLSVHPLRHVVAADPGVSAAALRHARRRIVRAAGTEIRDALGNVGSLGKCPLRRFQPRDIRGQFFVGPVTQQPLADADRDIVRIQSAFDWKQPVTLLVLFSDADRLIRCAVQLFSHLYFDKRAFLFDNDDEIEALCELSQLLAAERPNAGDFEYSQAEIVAFEFVDAEFVEGLAHVEISLAGRYHANPRCSSARSDNAIESVGTHKGEHGVTLEVMQTSFLTEERVSQADIETALRHAEVRGHYDIDALETGIDDAGRFHRLVHAFERSPGTTEARQRPTVKGVIGKLLYAGRIKDRHHHVDEMEF